ncbi:MAG TPA: bifunctional 4-hydroxy-2-oxoglutarate aldolase/2-dehydro-3-deoxy-phosphogluconate aldolase [Bryobacteraceae bacterium]|nr:bifunctional 4-hydroxy-2-oxoglutarate aldolase/2-dehydro-3-deoxy-phosphogluconate aldolase [Bryobacteraceae bacterium]
MNRAEVRTRIAEVGIIPALRVDSPQHAIFGAEAVFGGGIPIVELTMTIPNCVEVIRELAATHPDAAIGAGTVLDVDTAKKCLDAGASFLTSTGLDLEMVAFAERHEIAVIPGALTPTEVMTAHKAGVDFVKIFPCAQVGGPSYIRALKAPFPGVPMIASGGVNQQSAGDFIHAGSAALGIGEDLIPREAIAEEDLEWVRELCRRFRNIVTRARNGR